MNYAAEAQAAMLDVMMALEGIEAPTAGHLSARPMLRYG